MSLFGEQVIPCPRNILIAKVWKMQQMEFPVQNELQAGEFH